MEEFWVWIPLFPLGQSAYAHVRTLSRSTTAGFKRLQRVLWWRQSCRASTLTLTSSKRLSLHPAGRTSDFQFQLTSLRVFTLPSSLKRRCLHSRESRGTPSFNWHREREGYVQTFYTDVRAFSPPPVRYSIARRLCNQPSTNVLMETTCLP